MAKGWFKPFANKLARFIVVVCLTTGLMYSGDQAWNMYEHYVAIQAEQQFKATYLAPTVRVRVLTKDEDRNRFGSGVVIYSERNIESSSYDTYVLTCDHLFGDPSFHIIEVDVFDPSTRLVETVLAQMIARSTGGDFVKDLRDHTVTIIGGGNDLALLKLKTIAPLQSTKLMAPKDTWRLRLNNEVALVGCRVGARPTHTYGQVTDLQRRFIRINAPSYLGASGGPCIDVGTNTVIGIFSSLQGDGYHVVPHLALARSIFVIHRWLDDLGYRFLFDESASDEVRYDTIKKEEYRILQLEKQRKIMEKESKSLNGKKL